MNENQSAFAKEYSEISFWDKVMHYAKAAGKEVIELALQLFYALQDPATPPWAKAIIVAALGYFISPIDAIPDVTPLVGYADDAGVLTMAVASVATHITGDIKEKAKLKLVEWFGA